MCEHNIVTYTTAQIWKWKLMSSLLLTQISGEKKKEKIGTVKALEYKMDTTEQKNKK